MKDERDRICATNLHSTNTSSEIFFFMNTVSARESAVLRCERVRRLSDRGHLKGKHRMMMLLAEIQKSKGTLRQQSQSVLLTYLFLQQCIHPWRPYAFDSSHSMKNKVLNGALQYRAE